MAVFIVSAEHVHELELPRIVAFCKENKIRVTKSAMDTTFRGFAMLRIVGDTKRVANKVRKFIWDEINGGASCEIKKVAK